jgi:hypothetical protein
LLVITADFQGERTTRCVGMALRFVSLFLFLPGVASGMASPLGGAPPLDVQFARSPRRIGDSGVILTLHFVSDSNGLAESQRSATESFKSRVVSPEWRTFDGLGVRELQPASAKTRALVPVTLWHKKRMKSRASLESHVMFHISATYIARRSTPPSRIVHSPPRSAPLAPAPSPPGAPNLRTLCADPSAPRLSVPAVTRLKTFRPARGVRRA